MANRIKLKGTSERSFDIGLGPKQIFDANGLTANRTWVLPDSNGTNGYVLSTDGSGNLSWAAQTGGGTTQPQINFTAPSTGTNQTFTDSNLASFTNGSYANVFVNGVMLQTSEYSITGTTATFSISLNTGDYIQVAATSAGGGGGGGTPGGASTTVQFNDGGSFGGDSAFTWNKTSDTLTVAGDITAVDSITFDTTATETSAVAKMSWDDGYGMLQYTLKGGNYDVKIGEDLATLCYNGTGSSIAKGKVVYIAGAQGQRISVALADNSSDVTSSKTFGLVAETFPDGSEKFVVTQGMLRNINTAAYAPGTILYLGTAGDYTSTKPVAPAHLVFVGVVLKQHAVSGEIYVKPQNGYELDEIHNVLITNPVADNSTLLYDTSTSLWVNADPSTTINAILPTQTGNSGKYLTTDGSTASWATVGSTTSWPSGTVSAPGWPNTTTTSTGMYTTASTTSINFAVSGREAFRITGSTASNNTLAINSAAASTSPSITNIGTDTNGDGLSISITARSASATGQGGNITLNAGQALGAGNTCGSINLNAASGAAGINGGAININAGTGGGTGGIGGSVNIASGGGLSTNGNVNITTPSSRTPGNVVITAGTAISGGTANLSGSITLTPGASEQASSFTTNGNSAGNVTITAASSTASFVVSSGTNVGGSGSRVIIGTGNGQPISASSTANATGGAGGDVTYTLGNGGSATTSGSGTTTGGKGGSYAITTGNGASGGTAPGAGGDVTITLGNSGTGTGNANAGQFNIVGGTATGTGSISEMTFTNVRVKLKQYAETVVSGGSVSGTITPDAANGSIYTYTLTGSITLNSLSNAVAGTNVVIILTQGGTGSYTLSSTWKFAGGSKTLSTAVGAVDIISVFYDGSTYYASLTTGYA